MSITAAVFGYPSVSRSFTLSGGSWTAAYPLANLSSNWIQPQTKRVARSTNALTTSTIIRGTAATNQSVGTAMAAGNNLTASALVRLRLYSDAAWTTVVYDSGSVLRPGVWWAGANFTCRSFQIDVNDTGNPAGYVEVGYLELGTQIQPKYNFQFGADFGYRARTQKVEALGGAIYFDRRDKPRVFSSTFTVTSAEGLSLFLKMQEVFDLDIPFIFIQNPGDPTNWKQTAILARFAELNPMRYASYGLNEVAMNLEEVL